MLTEFSLIKFCNTITKLFFNNFVITLYFIYFYILLDISIVRVASRLTKSIIYYFKILSHDFIYLVFTFIFIS